jgi:TonB family protein
MKLCSIVLAMLLFTPRTSAAADDPLVAARDLYVSAAYEEALTTLTRLADSGQVPPAQAIQIDKYRSFCLYALGRTAEAESIAQSIIRKEPLFQIEGDDVSPRVEAMFTQASRQLLPGLIRDTYRLAKQSIDRKDFASAEPQLLQVHLMVEHAQKLGFLDESLADLGVLAEGFRDLARASAGTKPAAAAATSAAATAESAAVIAPVFDRMSPGVQPPVAIVQSVPAIPASLRTFVTGGPRRGVLEVVIDSDGHVADATMREPVNKVYDKLVVGAARQWRYKPATKDGVPVRFVIEIGLTIDN